MIAQTLQTLVGEVNGLWSWIIGIVAGWGLTLTLIIAGIVSAHVRINRMNRRLEKLKNQRITEDRELSFRIAKLEK